MLGNLTTMMPMSDLAKLMLLVCGYLFLDRVAFAWVFSILNSHSHPAPSFRDIFFHVLCRVLQNLLSQENPFRDCSYEDK